MRSALLAVLLWNVRRLRCFHRDGELFMENLEILVIGSGSWFQDRVDEVHLLNP